ncbi:hypothetical protein GGI42DRAFT_328370 [Trichoderma sp. SZMC 28013]
MLIPHPSELSLLSILCSLLSYYVLGISFRLRMGGKTRTKVCVYEPWMMTWVSLMPSCRLPRPVICRGPCYGPKEKKKEKEIHTWRERRKKKGKKRQTDRQGQN